MENARKEAQDVVPKAEVSSGSSEDSVASVKDSAEITQKDQKQVQEPVI